MVFLDAAAKLKIKPPQRQHEERNHEGRGLMFDISSMYNCLGASQHPDLKALENRSKSLGIALLNRFNKRLRNRSLSISINSDLERIPEERQKKKKIVLAEVPPKSKSVEILRSGHFSKKNILCNSV